MARIVGIGLVALDVVIDDDAQARLAVSAGGSCGNVMAILAWWGWDAAPVARLGTDANAEAVANDLLRWGVDVRWLHLEPAAATPVYIERLRRSVDGTASHRFDRYCAACGGRLPSYRAVPQAALEPVLDGLGEWDAIYIDRASAGAVRLARAARALNKLVVFEPSARASDEQIAALASAADIVKYSSDRLSVSNREMIKQARPRLEIETLGDAGLRFRARSGWRRVRAPRVTVRDSAGAGDWTTAMLLRRLIEEGYTHSELTECLLRKVLEDAAAVGAWSCQYEGPRGGMERHTPAAVIKAAQALKPDPNHLSRRRDASHSITRSWACSGCR